MTTVGRRAVRTRPFCDADDASEQLRAGSEAVQRTVDGACIADGRDGDDILGGIEQSR